MTSNKPRALLDATVFCGALVKPDGAHMRLLLAGNGGIFYQPIIAQSVVAEFISRAMRGIGRGSRRRCYTPEDMGVFFEALEPLLSPENSARVSWTVHRIFPASPLISLDDVVGSIIRGQVADVRRRVESLSHLCLDEVDPKDLHVYVAVAEHEPDYLVTNNVSDFPPTIGTCHVVKAGEFLKLIGF